MKPPVIWKTADIPGFEWKNRRDVARESPEGARFDSPGRSAAKPWVCATQRDASPNGAGFHRARSAAITERISPRLGYAHSIDA